MHTIDEKKAVAGCYINITQDAVGRLFFEDTPQNILGLYTSGIQTCTVLILVGQKGISLIHDSGLLSIQSINREFKLVGNIQSYKIIYNKEFCTKDGFENLRRIVTILSTNLKLDTELKIPQLLNNTMDLNSLQNVIQSIFCETEHEQFHLGDPFISSDKVYVDRKGEVFLRIPTSSFVNPINLQHRDMVNKVNNFLTMQFHKHLIMATEELEPDIQYSGTTLLPPPYLNKTPLEAKKSLAVIFCDPKNFDYDFNRYSIFLEWCYIYCDLARNQFKGDKKVISELNSVLDAVKNIYSSELQNLVKSRALLSEDEYKLKEYSKLDTVLRLLNYNEIISKADKSYFTEKKFWTDVVKILNQLYMTNQSQLDFYSKMKNGLNNPNIYRHFLQAKSQVVTRYNVVNLILSELEADLKNQQSAAHFDRHAVNSINQLRKLLSQHLKTRFVEIKACDFDNGLMLRNAAADQAVSPQEFTDLLANFRRYEDYKLIINRGGTNSKQTALHRAVLSGSAPKIKALLAAGADKNLKDNKEKTPYDYAQQNKELSQEILERLRPIVVISPATFFSNSMSSLASTSSVTTASTSSITKGSLAEGKH